MQITFLVLYAIIDLYLISLLVEKIVDCYQLHK